MKKIFLFLLFVQICNLTFSQNDSFDNKLSDTIKTNVKLPEDTIKKEEGNEKIYTEVEIKPEFPGGINGWIKYLERNINRDLPYKNGAPSGRYTVVLTFIVAKDGTISDIKAETDPGYGSKEEAIRLMTRSPKWKPAVQNGRNVTYRQKQSISFMVN
ncbi:energy transducer TonB [Sediminibacterium sp.]|uniref:energy transducer TonB n=1 Tax=Sediminibacterium sp. TaxID=1917865 RepID=UPI0027369AC1|nr:energy transducer TonB [Sediminibacterium sp.]MDP3394712.1 energy transducer TonB [Sediminibacterium sp.]MDP3568547.1 energy transducer TonB [Sediminibacterium sp.]